MFSTQPMKISTGNCNFSCFPKWAELQGAKQQQYHCQQVTKVITLQFFTECKLINETQMAIILNLPIGLTYKHEH